MGWEELGLIGGTLIGPLGTPVERTPYHGFAGGPKGHGPILLGGEVEGSDPITPGPPPPTPPVKGPRIGAGSGGFAGSGGDPNLLPFKQPGSFGSGMPGVSSGGGEVRLGGARWELWRNPLTGESQIVRIDPYTPLGFGADWTVTQEKVLQDAMRDIAEKLPCLETFPGLLDCILREFKRTKVAFKDDGTCSHQARQGRAIRAESDAGNNRLELCPDLLKKERAAELRAVLLHELAHLCGAGEMEAEIIENYCCAASAGQSPCHGGADFDDRAKEMHEFLDDFTPPRGVWPSLVPLQKKRYGEWDSEPGMWEGRFIYYDCRTGRIYIKIPGQEYPSMFYKANELRMPRGVSFNPMGQLNHLPGCIPGGEQSDR